MQIIFNSFFSFAISRIVIWTTCHFVSLILYTQRQGCTNSVRHVVVTTKFCFLTSNICGASLWNLYHATNLVPDILSRRLYLWKFCAPLHNWTSQPNTEPDLWLHFDMFSCYFPLNCDIAQVCLIFWAGVYLWELCAPLHNCTSQPKTEPDLWLHFDMVSCYSPLNCDIAQVCLLIPFGENSAFIW